MGHHSKQGVKFRCWIKTTRNRATVKRFGKNRNFARARELIPSGPANEINFPKFRPKPICLSCNSNQHLCAGESFTNGFDGSVSFSECRYVKSKSDGVLFFKYFCVVEPRSIIFERRSNRARSIIPNNCPRSLAQQMTHSGMLFNRIIFC